LSIRAGSIELAGRKRSEVLNMASRAFMAVASLTGNPAGDIYSLDDDAVKLVAYTIVSVKRGHERVMEGNFAEGSLIVTERMSAEAFAAWMIGRYLQQVDPGNPNKQVRETVADDLKYLRIYFVVSTRWPREPLKFEERQIDALREIEQKI
jgi:hypothetical protein